MLGTPPKPSGINRTQRTRFAKVLSGSAQALCGLVAARAGSVVGPSFFLRPPATVEAMSLATICCGPGSLFLGRRAADCRISCARLRFSAAIKAITGGRVMTSQTDRGANSRPELIMDPAGIPCREISDALREAVEANQSKRFKKQPQNRGAAPATHLLSFNKPTAI